MIIRFACLEDLYTLAQIEKQCFPSCEAANFQQLKERFHQFSESFLVAEIEGQIVGFINGAMIDSTVLSDLLYHDASLHQRNGLYQCVFGLDVLPNYQHKGIAQKLMKAFIELSQVRNKKGMILTCKKPLISFYEQFGYQCQGVSLSSHGNATWYDMIFKWEHQEWNLMTLQSYHLNECAQIFKECFQSKDWNEQWTQQQAYQRLKEMLSNPYALGYVMYYHQEMAAFVLGREMTYCEHKEFWIDEVCVTPVLQNQHIGSRMLDMVKSQCQKRYIQKMTLITLNGRLSQRFYKYNDFKIDEHLVSMSCIIDEHRNQ